MNALPEVISHAFGQTDQTRPRPLKRGPLPLDPLRDPGWDALVAAHRDATLFHSAAWARVLKDTYRHSPVYFGRRQNDRLESLLPVMEVNSPWTGRRGVSLPFTDECPLLAENSAAVAQLHEQALAHGRERRWKYFETRGGPRPPGTDTPSVLYYAHELDLTPGEKHLFEHCESATRRGIRRAQNAGVRIDRRTDLGAMRSFYRLHCGTRRRHGVPPQPFRFFENIARHVLVTGHGSVFTASHCGRVVAAAVFFHLGRQAIYKFGASDFSAQEQRPNNLLMWEAIRFCAERGCETLQFGRTSLANEGLRRFKLGFGTRERQLPAYRFEFRRNRFVATVDRAEGPLNRVFRQFPSPILRLLGATLYPHLS